MTEDEAQEMIRKLEQHYAEPVMRVSFYCNALRTWYRALVQRHGDLYERYKNSPPTNEHDQKYLNREIQREAELLAGLSSIMIMISKSNLLARLIYGKEPIRTIKCAEHKGHWSGLAEVVNCPHGCDGTGWLHNNPGDRTDPTRLPGPRLVTLTPMVPRKKRS